MIKVDIQMIIDAIRHATPAEHCAPEWKSGVDSARLNIAKNISRAIEERNKDFDSDQFLNSCSL
jgi:hypothetical protein